MIDANGDRRYGGKDYATKTAHELNSETALLPVGFSPDGNDEKQYSSGKEFDLDGRSTATCGDLSEKKISLEELLRLESAEESQNACTISSARSENHMPPVGQVSKNVCHAVEALASKTDDLFRSGVSSEDIASASSATTSERRDATVASDEPFCTVGMTDSSSDLASGSKGLVGTEPRSAALTSTSSDVQSSEYSKDHSESPALEAIIDALDENEATVATSSSPHIVEPSDANGEGHKSSETDKNGGSTDVHDLNQIDEESSIDAMADDAQSGSTHVVELQCVPESAKGKSRNGNVYPFEPSSFGPSSIMSAPVVSTSGHIAYSGNTSLRSDSSTTSTRSFAFPVLQRDWTSSPVMMAKAERRRIRRRRGGWRKGLICCKF